MAVTLDSLKKTVGKKKVKSMAFAWLADYENQAGDSTTALARVDAGLQLYPGDIPGMLVRTKLLFQLGDFEECVKECERILQKEPFCLSAQKRMGEAYEKLENIDERNRCYRRVHDMDPIDTFWKEEYEAVPDAAVDAAAVAGAVAAGEAAADSEFAMPDMGEFTMDTAAESAEPAVEASADATAGEEPAAKEEDSLFSKSLDMDIESPATEAAEEPEQPKASASPFSASDDEDPFAALSSLGNDDSLADESSIDSLQQSLESALGDAATDITLDQDIPEAEEISGNDVGSAFADLFGEEDDMDSFGETTESKPASPFAQMDLPTSLDDEPAAPEDSAKNVFGEEAVEDKPQSIDDAFGDIFGEDELPEELPSNTAAPKAEPAEEQKPEEESFSGGMFEKSAAADMGLGAEEDDLKLEEPEPEPAKEADKPQSLDSAFADIFGEDELPEELPPAQPAGESDVSADLELPADSSTGALTEDADLELPSLDDSTSALTDELEMPSEEKPADDKPAESLDTFDIANWSPDAKPADDASLELPAEEETPAEEPTLELPAADEAPAEEVADLELPAEEPAVEPSLEMPAEESALEMPAEETPAEPAVEEAPAEEFALDIPAEEPSLELPAEETPAEEAADLELPAEEPAQEKPADESADVGFSVDKAFDALFADDDELPEEKPAETASAESEVLDNVTETTEPVEDAAESDSDRAELDKEMDSAFSSLFAEDDDLPVEESKPEAAAAPEATQEDTGAALEEAPLADAALESDLDKSFSSLFGEDDALDEADLKPAEAPAADATAEPAAAEELPEVSATQGNAGIESSLESEFSGAFKQLFNTDDDSLDEKADLPSNKGVDFLMSGDSDDEVSAGLVADPTAPLDKQSSDLDDGMKTPTLGEIYFEQGHYDRALEIYKELAEKDPENEAIANRLAEVQKAYDSKFGGEQNG
ncbi:Tetratricopeptide repeat-containing protein [Fibrobacter sp. UWT3]|uniref:tetratricopeptide repeat protein n=1 Tax=Fibrobacter sp. UWT3 TaxID=1896225 RepID=UPI000BD35D8D|nr:tetratricopeptide repeat protein [Fibrobacter sp. UWT3]SOE78361.1 Tetratricopeptide repeat-containing protein [Fibrobacter sp. UWT3]